MLPVGEVPETVLGDDDGAVDDQAEVDRAETHQVGADFCLQHAGDRQQHRGRNHQRRDQCRAKISEQGEQDDDDEERALRQVLGDRGDGGVDQLRPVQHGLCDDPGRQRLVDRFDPGSGGGGHRPAVAADQHQRGTEHGLVPVEAGAAGPQFTPDRHLGQILHPQRRVATGGDDDLADLGDILDAAGGPHDIILAVALDIVRAAAGIVGLHRLDDVGERDAIGDRLGRIRRDLILLDIAADRIGAGDTRHRPHLRANNPVLHRAQIDRALEIVAQMAAFRREIAAVALPTRLAVGDRRILWRLLVFDRPPIHFAQPRRDRTELDLGLGRKRLPDLLQTLIHLLPREVNAGLVAEHRRHLGKAVAGE